jgi:hypothetical protein
VIWIPGSGFDLDFSPCKDFVGEMGTLTGWGQLWDNGPLADQLMQVKRCHTHLFYFGQMSQFLNLTFSNAG